MSNNMDSIMSRFKPVSRAVIDTVTDETFRNSRIVKQDRFVGAGRRFGDRGTPGYKDNLLPVDGYDVKSAIIAASKRNDGGEVVIGDVGCANGQGLVDIIRFAARYQGIDVQGIGLTANPKEYLTNKPAKGTPAVNGKFERDEDGYIFTFDLVKKDGSKGTGVIRYGSGDIHNLPKSFSPDVTMSMACVKYSHDPWAIFAGLLRKGDPQGQVFVGHLLDGTGKRKSKQPIYTLDGTELSPREYMEEFQKINQDMVFSCNEDSDRKVTNESGEKVYNRRKFYAGDHVLNDFRDELRKTRVDKGSTKDVKLEADRELLRVSGNGFFNVSVNRNGNNNPFLGLLYVGDKYGEKTEYLFVPDKDTFQKLVAKGYQAV